MTRLHRTLGDVACTLAFALAVAIPLGGRALDPEADLSTAPEQRNPAGFPKLGAKNSELSSLPRDLDAWIGDRYAFRGQLIRWHNVVKLLGFGVSPTDRLVVGDERWLFTTANLALDAHRGLFQLSERDLDAWASALAERSAWCAERGIRYVVTFAPGKPAIYPERLPAAYGPPADAETPRTPLEQLHAHLTTPGPGSSKSGHPGIELLDLRPAMRAARDAAGTADVPNDWLYYRLGTHWTERGAWVAYRELMSLLAAQFPALSVPSVDDYRRAVTEDAGDSWSGRLRINDLLPQRNVKFSKRDGHRSIARVDEPYNKVFELPGELSEGRPRLLLFHDSFGDHLRDYLREDCAYFAAHNSVDFEVELIEEERPDVVIQLMAERRLATYRPPVSALAGAQAAQLAFDRAGPELFALDSAERVSAVTPWRRARLTPASASDDPPLTVRVRRAGDGILLPELEFDGRAPVLRIDIDAPEATELSIFYQTPESREYISMRQIARPLPAGRTVVHIDLGVRDAVGELLILPGRVRGDYVLRGLELRPGTVE